MEARESVSLDVPAPRPSSYEFRSRLRIGGLPLVHVVRGVDPATGRRPPAVGIIAIGQVAVGIVSIGQLAIGFIALGQAALGIGWGVGQLAIGALAAGQVALGGIGSVGQLAMGPHALGILQHGGPWAPAAWFFGGALLALFALLRARRLAPLLALIPERGGSGISGLRDGLAHASGRVVSDNHARSPLSNRACVFWQALRIGPGIHARERGGDGRLVVISDNTGQAYLDLSGPVTFIRNDSYMELPAPDWSVYMETCVAKGDLVYVGGPVSLEAHPDSEGLYRSGHVAPVFRGEPDAPLVLTTQSPLQLKAELRLAMGIAGALMSAGAITMAYTALAGLVGA